MNQKNFHLFPQLLFCLAILICQAACNSMYADNPGEDRISVWYGKTQVFGATGNPQRCLNILGNILTGDQIIEASYSLNSSPKILLSLGQNDTRLARDGDFNAEIDRSDLKAGNNTLQIEIITSTNLKLRETVAIKYFPDNQWPLPYEVNWSKVKNITDAVQIIDGKWKLTKNGIRTVEPYYDRVIAIGDAHWNNVEVTTSVIFHNFTPPAPGPPTYNVSHAAIAMRWPGHEDDGKQPNVQWYPLGATCEFKLNRELDACRFRIIGDRKIYNENAEKIHQVELGEKYFMKAQVISEGENSIYRAKFWAAGTQEPPDWDITSVEGPTDIQNGSVLLIAHNTDVTFGNLKIIAVK